MQIRSWKGTIGNIRRARAAGEEEDGGVGGGSGCRRGEGRQLRERMEV